MENRRLAGLVKQIHNESPDKGYRRIRDDLARYYAYYNFSRLQRRLGVHTPMEVYTQCRAT
jgi:hypothetical protein